MSAPALAANTMTSKESALLNATVVKNTVLSPGLFELWIQPDEPIPDFTPGQYVALGLPDITSEKPKLIKRAYSIASSPLQKDALQFYIAVVEEGALSPRLAELAVGDRIFSQKKYVGTFTTDPVPENSRAIFVATGTGIAPYISMLRTPDVVAPFKNISVVHGVRFARDLAYREELSQYKKQFGDAFEYFATVSREGPPEWLGDKGYVQKFFYDEVLSLDPDQDHIFLCGNPAMITELTEWLLARGFKEHKRRDPGNLHYEKYW